MILNSPTISGSLTVTGNIIASGSITLSGSVASASYALSASNAATASSADNFLTRGTLTAQTLVVQTITSSVDFVTGSTRFGSISANTHNFTGSVLLSGSFGLNKAVPQRQYTQVANANGIVFSIQNAAASNEGYIVGFDAIGSTYTQLSDSANAAKVYLNSSGSSYINGGNVGIGTTTPTDIAGFTSLTIDNSASGPLIDLNNSGTNNMRLLCLSAVDQRIYGAGALSFYTSGSNRMSITNAGNIQIDSAQLNTPKSLYFAANTNTGGSLGDISWYNYQWDALIRAQIKGETDTGLNNGRLVFSTGTGGVTERMRISSTGVVTKPYQPFAMGGLDGNQSISLNTFTTLNFSTTVGGFYFANVGSCWNNTTRAFTAPVTGVYMINVSLLTDSVGQVALYVNGARKHSIPSWYVSSSVTWGGSAMIPLTAGDALTLQGYGNAGSVSQNTFHTFFAIYLLG